MERIQRVRHRFRTAGIVLVIVGPLIVISAWIHAAIARVSQIGLVDLVLAISGVAALCVGLELFVARRSLVGAEKLNGLARTRYIRLMVIGIAICGTVIAGVLAYLVGASVTIETGLRFCDTSGC